MTHNPLKFPDELKEKYPLPGAYKWWDEHPMYHASVSKEDPFAVYYAPVSKEAPFAVSSVYANIQLRGTEYLVYFGGSPYRLFFPSLEEAMAFIWHKLMLGQ